MKVKDCRKCPHCVRRRYKIYYQPMNYHEYAWCKLYGKRVRNVKECNGKSGYFDLGWKGDAGR